mmetsp:Transcript_9458/g.29328  ORF Transcript_9458/g.29328 Transcript_9458/m.29328 type:complete len:200 (+) Transcript_9458:265-864(+)
MAFCIIFSRLPWRSISSGSTSGPSSSLSLSLSSSSVSLSLLCPAGFSSLLSASTDVGPASAAVVARSWWKMISFWTRSSFEPFFPRPRRTHSSSSSFLERPLQFRSRNLLALSLLAAGAFSAAGATGAAVALAGAPPLRFPSNSASSASCLASSSSSSLAAASFIAPFSFLTFFSRSVFCCFCRWTSFDLSRLTSIAGR